MTILLGEIVIRPLSQMRKETQRGDEICQKSWEPTKWSWNSKLD